MSIRGKVTMDIITRMVHAGQCTDQAYGSVTPPIYQTSTFAFEDVGKTTGFEYSRLGNPTRQALEEILAEMEGGAGAVATASGMAAISTALSIFENNIHVICTHDCYGGTVRLLNYLADQGKIQLNYADLNDEAGLASVVQSNTRVLWVETPSNPLLRITDLKKVSEFARARGLTVIVDNTFLSPIFQQPIALGADLVVHSTTKYLNGHADVVGGAVIAATEDLHREIRFAAKTHGGIAAPFDSWLVLRGLKTLHLRMAQHEKNAMAVAEFLAGHSRVDRVFYPGLPSDPGHALARTQQSGFGGMVSFAVRGGEGAAHRVLGRTQLFTLAESLGGVESLIGHPVTMSHASMPRRQRDTAGIMENVIRLSVGIEATDDLLADLAQALE